MRQKRIESTSPVTILKVIVGSHAHRLALPTSDIDYRGVFVHPTSELLKLDKAYALHPDKETDLDRVNETLLDIRKEFWE